MRDSEYFRLRETPEKRKRRLEKLAAYAAARRAKETPEERERRLQDMRERQKKRVQQKKKLQQQVNRKMADETPSENDSDWIVDHTQDLKMVDFQTSFWIL